MLDESSARQAGEEYHTMYLPQLWCVCVYSRDSGYFCMFIQYSSLLKLNIFQAPKYLPRTLLSDFLKAPK